jgi:hypothetical protein
MNDIFGYKACSLELPIHLPVPNHPSFTKKQEVCAPLFEPILNLDLLNQYCLCDLSPKEQISSELIVMNDYSKNSSKKFKNKKDLMLNLGNFSQKAEELLRVLSSISSTNISIVSGKRKAKSRHGPMSSKRSCFIGVSRNGPHWQALITINKRKTYIGSYQTEQQAAVAFDFYSILLHSLSAKTNFSYTKEDIVDMIRNFSQNDEKLRPETLSFFTHTV